MTRSLAILLTLLLLGVALPTRAEREPWPVLRVGPTTAEEGTYTTLQPGGCLAAESALRVELTARRFEQPLRFFCRELAGNRAEAWAIVRGQCRTVRWRGRLIDGDRCVGLPLVGR